MQEKKERIQDKIEEIAFNEISISDSLIDMLPDVPGGEII